MSEKGRKEKLGRNPFEQKKPARKHKSYEGPEPVRSDNAMKEPEISRTEAAPAARGGPERLEEQNPLLGDPRGMSKIPATATLAWLCVDLWSSTFFEPMFFWMNSPKIMREAIKAASGREA